MPSPDDQEVVFLGRPGIIKSTQDIFADYDAQYLSDDGAEGGIALPQGSASKKPTAHSAYTDTNSRPHIHCSVPAHRELQRRLERFRREYDILYDYTVLLQRDGWNLLNLLGIQPLQ